MRNQQKAVSQQQQPKSRPATKKKAANPWHLEGMSAETKATIAAAAESEGLTIAQYLEQLVLQHEKEAAPVLTPEPDRETLNRISALEQRLNQIEEQRGFWGSFWDKVMNSKE